MDQLKRSQELQVRNILIVDDDHDTCKLLETIFQISGYTTKVVHNGQEAVHYVLTNTPDIVVLDIMMPEMDGWETLARMRSQSDIPVLFLTALTSGDYAVQAFDLGGNDFMRKPFTNGELLARVDLLLSGVRPSHKKANLLKVQHLFGRSIPITVIIPAYNEARFIGSTVLKACEYADTVIVVDDGSNDNTADIADEAGAVLVRHTCNKGKGAALNTGFKKARELNSQVVVTLDADGQHLPEELAQVIAPVLSGEADIVIGSRYLMPLSEVPFLRIMGHRVFNFITKKLAGVAATDSQSGYRAFSAKAIEAISFQSSGFSVESEMQFLAHEANLQLIEVPITIRYQDKPKRSVWQHGMLVLDGILHLTSQYRPLLFFGISGLVLLLGGLIAGLWVVERYRILNQLAIGTAMISMMLLIIGLLLLSTGVILHSVRVLIANLFRYWLARSHQ